MATTSRTGRRQGQAARRPQPRPPRRRLGMRGIRLIAPLAAGIGVLGLLGLSSGGAEAPDKPGFPIRTLKVEASFEQVSSSEIAALVGPLASDGFFDTSVGDVKDALIAMPWVRAAEVRRVWPDTLHITVIEERAAARWVGGGLLNPAGEVFRPGSSIGDLDELPLLEGPAGTSRQVMQQYRRLNARLQPLDLEIRTLRMDPRRSWRLAISNGMTLVLGRRDTELQIERFARFYPEVIDGRARDIDAIDLRYPNGFAVKWRTPATHAGAGGNPGDKG